MRLKYYAVLPPNNARAILYILSSRASCSSPRVRTFTTFRSRFDHGNESIPLSLVPHVHIGKDCTLDNLRTDTGKTAIESAEIIYYKLSLEVVVSIWG